MAKDKKSFLIYCDIIHSIDHLTNEEKGVLFQHLLEYVNDMNPELENRVLISAWKPIERQLKRDLEKYENVRKRNSENARIRWNKKNATASDRINSNANSTKNADNDIDNDTDNDTEIIDKSITINNSKFKNESKECSQWIETICMQNKVKLEVVMLFLDNFDKHLITMEEQKKNIKEYKQHFAYWLKKQNLSQFIDKPIGRTNQTNAY